jgi:hypothetical protein
MKRQSGCFFEWLNPPREAVIKSILAVSGCSIPEPIQGPDCTNSPSMMPLSAR